MKDANVRFFREQGKKQRSVLEIRFVLVTSFHAQAHNDLLKFSNLFLSLSLSEVPRAVKMEN